jgi:cyclophilin family peptidyl-prolyl cis-trans isomerase
MSPGRSGRQKKFKHTPRKSNKLPIAIGLLTIIIVSTVAIYLYSLSTAPAESLSTEPAGKVLLNTSKGDITIQLRNDRPITTSNFKNLIQNGVYDGTIFHRVIAGFMIQGGMNTSASVETIPDEVSSNNHNDRGTVAMAKTSQPNSATSQFYINVVDNNYLDSEYTVFGTVISGMDVADEISNVSVDGEQPVTDVVIIKAEIIS